jgi:hypothetical protein
VASLRHVYRTVQWQRRTPLQLPPPRDRQKLKPRRPPWISDTHTTAQKGINCSSAKWISWTPCPEQQGRPAGRRESRTKLPRHRTRRAGARSLATRPASPRQGSDSDACACPQIAGIRLGDPPTRTRRANPPRLRFRARSYAGRSACTPPAAPRGPNPPVRWSLAPRPDPPSGLPPPTPERTAGSRAVCGPAHHSGFRRFNARAWPWRGGIWRRGEGRPARRSGGRSPRSGQATGLGFPCPREDASRGTLRWLALPPGFGRARARRTGTTVPDERHTAALLHRGHGFGLTHGGRWHAADELSSSKQFASKFEPPDRVVLPLAL